MSFDIILPFLRPIAHLIEDADVSEIMVNGSRRVFVEREGVVHEATDIRLDERNLRVAVKNIARALGDDVSEEKPILDSRLPDLPGAVALALLAFLAAALTGCGGDGPQVRDHDVSEADEERCEALIAALPDEVAGEERVELDEPYTAAWGDPAIILRCGVGEPEGFDDFSTCQRAAGVDWFVPEEIIEDQRADILMTTVGRSPTVDVLIPALQDADIEFRQNVVFALGQLRDVRAIPGLTVALKDANEEVRERAAFALAQLRDPRAVDPLLIAVRDSNSDVRKQALFAIGQIDASRGKDVAIEALKDKDAEVRRMAAHLLGRLARD